MKECACKSLHYRFGPNWDTCVECGHTPMFHFAHFNRTILNPIQRCVGNRGSVLGRWMFEKLVAPLMLSCHALHHPRHLTTQWGTINEHT